MSGAAGALVPLASANRLSGIMSALTLLSVIAPTVPSAPQGPSGEAASGFQSLLAALSGEAAVTPETKAGPAETPMLVEAKVETEVEAPTAAGFLVAPTPPPLVLPAAEGSAPTADGPATGGVSDGSADRTGEAGADLPSPTPAGAASDRDGLQTTTPLPTDKNPTAKTNEPQVQPRAADIRPVTGETSETQLTLAETAALNDAVEARARTGAAPAPSSPPPAAPPAPLRPLAERTSRPSEASVATTGDAFRAADPAQPAAATPPAADRPARPADFAAVVGREASNGGEAERPTSELPLPVEGATAQTQAPAGARETGVTQLSRATIEATAQIAAQILRRLEGRSTRFEMALTPDELGRVDVKLDIDSEGRLNARLAFDNPAAATDLRGRADELRRQLEDAGFHLAEDAFEFADRDSGSSAFDRGQDARNGSSRAFAAASRLNTETDVAQPPRWLALSLSPSGVDMKV